MGRQTTGERPPGAGEPGAGRPGLGQPGPGPSGGGPSGPGQVEPGQVGPGLPSGRPDPGRPTPVPAAGTGIRLGTPFGVPIYVSPSWFLIAGFITYLLAPGTDTILGAELGNWRF